MTCKKQYACDLCHDEMREPSDGIGIQWSSGPTIKAVYYLNSEHHLCNRCIEGLRDMFKELAKTIEMYRHLDAPEDEAQNGPEERPDWSQIQRS